MDHELEQALQGLSNSLDAKIKRYNTKGYINLNDPIENLITNHFSEIKEIKRGDSMQFKAVGDMTLGNLTGDQPRSYGQVVMIPGQKLNVEDLVDKVPIENGTFTYPKETGGEGTVAKQTEGALKNQLDFDLEMIDINTDFIAGFTVFSKKMRNNLGFLNAFIPQALRRNYYKAENSIFNGILETEATASTEIITGQNKVEMLIAEVSKLEEAGYNPTTIVVRPVDFYSMLATEKSTGSGYGLPGIFHYSNGMFTLNGIQIVKATWLSANSYFVGDWTFVKKVVTEDFSIQFSESDVDNFRKNMISSRAEQQCNIAVTDSNALVFGSFIAV